MSTKHWSAAVFFAVTAAATLVGVQAAEPAPLKWQTNLNEAHRLSMETHKPMLLVFGAEWCHFCKKLERTTLTNEELARYIDANFIPVHIDADEQKRVAEILEVKSLPCTVVLSPEADLLTRFNGFKQASAFYDELVKARELHSSSVQMASRSVPGGVSRP
jgi:thioredoxin-like negative regulator of GroEL